MKLKRKKSAVKRFSIGANGLLYRYYSCHKHNLSNKNRIQKKRLSKKTEVHKHNYATILKLIR